MLSALCVFGSCSSVWFSSYLSHLSGIYLGIVWKSGRGATKRKTPFHPYSPYAVAKLYGFWIVKNTVKLTTCFAVQAYCSIMNRTQRRNVCYAQNNFSSRTYQTRQTGKTLFRQSLVQCAIGAMLKIM